ncbi:MAG: hypothetical protein JRJ26_00820 [Deltaproteobacteria bacterium]|nr:hypothetical protein [Deltaproteobacteria bacterium]
MRDKAVYLCVALALMLGLPAGRAAGLDTSGRTMTLMTTGTTIVIEGNLARARSMAIANGKRNALEAAVRELIPETLALENYDLINQEIYQSSGRFIDTFRILSETTRENIYEVNLESTVAVERLRKTLVNLGLIEEEPGGAVCRFRFEVSGVSCAACITKLRNYLEKGMESVERVSLYSISPGRFTFRVVLRGDMEAFRDALISESFEDFRLDPEGMSEGVLRLAMVPYSSQEGLWR